jgi:hypothetical protein
MSNRTFIRMPHAGMRIIRRPKLAASLAVAIVVTGLLTVPAFAHAGTSAPTTPLKVALPAIIQGYDNGPVPLSAIGGQQTITQMSLPIGKWDVLAKAYIVNTGDEFTVFPDCQLSSGTALDSDELTLDSVINGQETTATLDMSIAVVLTSAGTVTLSCNVDGQPALQMDSIKINAIKARSLSIVQLSSG